MVNSMRVLSVTPAEDDQKSLFHMLDEMPFTVTMVRTCREAATALQQAEFDVIVCERSLPDGSWLELLERISDTGNTPLLIVTSRLADESLWAEVLNLGGYDVLATPFHRQEVHHVLTSAWVQRVNPVRNRRPLATASA